MADLSQVEPAVAEAQQGKDNFPNILLINCLSLFTNTL